VKAGENGLLTPPDDVPALAQAIGTVLENLAGFALGAQDIRDTIVARFSIQTIAQQHVSLYRELFGD
jgi:glycosyltransferase involved in cell wall biosynthesis